MATIRCYGKTSDEFAVTSGVRQGCVLAPTLFNLYYAVATRMALENGQPKGSSVGVAYLHGAKLVDNCKKLQHDAIISDLEYANDMALVAESWDDLNSMLDDVSIRCRDLGLTISCSKTKTLAVLPSHLYPKPVLINLFPNDDPVEVVSSFQYLGSIVQDNCGTVIEVDSRICTASKAFHSLCRILYAVSSMPYPLVPTQDINSHQVPYFQCCCTANPSLWPGEFGPPRTQITSLAGFCDVLPQDYP